MAELGLGIVGAVAAVDIAIKACKAVIDACSAFRNADKEVSERGTRLRSNCVAMRLQLELVRQIRDTLDEDGRDVQDEVLQTLTSKLGVAEAKLKSLVRYQLPTSPARTFPADLNMSKRERSKYVIQKDQLDRAIEEVESWQQLSFTPLWLVTMKAQSHQFNTALHVAKKDNPNEGSSVVREAMAVRDPLLRASSARVFLPPEEVYSATVIEIAFSSVKLVQIEGRWRLLDSVLDLSPKVTRDLAVKLRNANPLTFSLLTCFGAVHLEKKQEMNLVFRMPEDMSDPESLRAKLMTGNSCHSLSERFRMAAQLARAVCSVHTFGMVHKSIRPENIIVFRDRESVLGSAFLLGFERIRREDDQTRLSGDTNWEKNLYRHPQRQGAKLQESYVMQHDIYSLGVCLLEIGLWSSFVIYANPSEPVPSTSYNFDSEVPSSNVEYSNSVKESLVTLAREDLPRKMGSKYAKVVQTCLTCLDEGNEDFNDPSEFQDEDGILVAMRYIKKVLIQLGDISI